MAIKKRLRPSEIFYFDDGSVIVNSGITVTEIVFLNKQEAEARNLIRAPKPTTNKERS